MYLVPVAAVLALLFAAYLAAKVSKQDAGTDRMKEIAGREFDTLKSKKVLQSLEIGLFFCQIFIFII